MNDLISRRAAIKAIDDLPNCYNGYSDTYDKAYIIGTLEELPKDGCEYWDGESGFCALHRPADMATLLAYESGKRSAEPKKGKWEHHIGIGNVALMKCGECGFTYPELLGMMLFNYCPNCGARMDGKEQKGEIK